MADGLVNPWAAGTDALLNTLAQREAAARLEEQRERQRQLDAEEKADRERMRTHQENQLRDLAESRREAAADRQAGIDARAAESAAKGLKNFELQGLVDQYQHEKDPIRKAQLKEQLIIKHEIRFPEEKAPKARTGSWRQVKGPGGTEQWEWFWDPLEGETPQKREVYHAPVAGEKPDKPEKPVRADLLLPPDTKTWIDKLAGQGLGYEETANLLSQGWEGVRGGHPEADMTAGLAYLEKLYQKNPVTNKLVPIMRPPAAAGGGPAGPSAITPESTAAFGAAFGQRPNLGVPPPGAGAILGGAPKAPGGVGGLVLPPGLGAAPGAGGAAPGRRPPPPEIVEQAVAEFFKTHPTVPQTPANLAAARKRFGG
jgi:hypothetical protein